MSKILDVLKSPKHLWLTLDQRGFFKWIPDKIYIIIKYKIKTNKKLDLRNPKSFNEKLQWLKLYDQNPAYIVMADKEAVKKYVASKIGEEHIVPTIGKWNDVDEINFNELPNQFVLKVNHDSGGIIVCKDKEKLDVEKAKKKIKKCLLSNGYWYGREWIYKEITPCIIAEKYLEEKEHLDIQGLTDYKFYCFNGIPKFLYVAKSNFIDGEKNDLLSIYDLKWNQTPFQRIDHMPLPYKIERPDGFNQMIEFSKILSKDIPFVRVDWYEINGIVYFGEMTFFPGSGYGEFSPDKYNYIIGNWITLSDAYCNKNREN